MIDAADEAMTDRRQPRALTGRWSTGAVVRMVLIGLCLGAMLAYPRLERAYEVQIGDRDRATLELATQNLRGALNRAAVLPPLLAERPILARVLRDPTNAGLLPFVNEQLRQTALSLDVSDIYLMDRTGLTIAASSYRTERSFVGRNFAYRPYFTDALDGGIGRFHALGTTSGERGYFFAAPVSDERGIIGVVAVKITLDAFEATWAESGATIIVQDMSNVIFLSDRADWHFRTLGPMVEAALETIAQTRQYPITALRPLAAHSRPLGGANYQILTIDDPGGRAVYVMQTGLIAAAGWRVSILSPIAPARAQALTSLAIAALIALFGLMVSAVIGQRRAQLEQQLATRADEQTRLEARVRGRTAELDAANRLLRHEIDERVRTEAQLRRTQTELIQAGKLAALGQMSAALSHEFNQPLAAMKAYAENTATFLERGRMDEARENIRLISAMADKMASISRHLRNFARRPQDKTGPVPIHAVIADALDLMAPRLDKSAARVIPPPPGNEIWVTGGRVRLQQVIVNLIGNALDAMDGTARPTITLTLTVMPQTGRCQLALRDTGPGLSQDALSQAFDPFFTTKAPGKGLGLGLSISYNIVRDFNGRLMVANHPDGGAVFTVDLELTTPPAEIAAP
ncbi:ATP-binding protein [uncultured Roseicyclus sp.]|jgi:two-component system, NtrC family, C4-dicarboxylate transport sensor histidine kinase DctB|uniref:sensor histidine kinase n=1 Tax=uncultured Roseicyclus sp. TaxID=543072 RepID=UPI00261B78FB|nr:ATP-binding protein [uncultured Roseicyclus sp.]